MPSPKSTSKNKNSNKNNRSQYYFQFNNSNSTNHERKTQKSNQNHASDQNQNQKSHEPLCTNLQLINEVRDMNELKGTTNHSDDTHNKQSGLNTSSLNNHSPYESAKTTLATVHQMPGDINDNKFKELVSSLPDLLRQINDKEFAELRRSLFHNYFYDKYLKSIAQLEDYYNDMLDHQSFADHDLLNFIFESLDLIRNNRYIEDKVRNDKFIENSDMCYVIHYLTRHITKQMFERVCHATELFSDKFKSYNNFHLRQYNLYWQDFSKIRAILTNNIPDMATFTHSLSSNALIEHGYLQSFIYKLGDINNIKECGLDYLVNEVDAWAYLFKCCKIFQGNHPKQEYNSNQKNRYKKHKQHSQHYTFTSLANDPFKITRRYIEDLYLNTMLYEALEATNIEFITVHTYNTNVDQKSTSLSGNNTEISLSFNMTTELLTKAMSDSKALFCVFRQFSILGELLNSSDFYNYLSETNTTVPWYRIKYLCHMINQKLSKSEIMTTILHYIGVKDDFNFLAYIQGEQNQSYDHTTSDSDRPSDDEKSNQYISQLFKSLVDLPIILNLVNEVLSWSITTRQRGLPIYTYANSREQAHKLWQFYAYGKHLVKNEDLKHIKNNLKTKGYSLPFRNAIAGYLISQPPTQQQIKAKNDLLADRQFTSNSKDCNLIYAMLDHKENILTQKAKDTPEMIYRQSNDTQKRIISRKYNSLLANYSRIFARRPATHFESHLRSSVIETYKTLDTILDKNVTATATQTEDQWLIYCFNKLQSIVSELGRNNKHQLKQVNSRSGFFTALERLLINKQNENSLELFALEYLQSETLKHIRRIYNNPEEHHKLKSAIGILKKDQTMVNDLFAHYHALSDYQLNWTLNEKGLEHKSMTKWSLKIHHMIKSLDYLLNDKHKLHKALVTDFQTLYNEYKQQSDMAHQSNQPNA